MWARTKLVDPDLIKNYFKGYNYNFITHGLFDLAQPQCKCIAIPVNLLGMESMYSRLQRRPAVSLPAGALLLFRPQSHFDNLSRARSILLQGSNFRACLLPKKSEQTPAWPNRITLEKKSRSVPMIQHMTVNN